MIEIFAIPTAIPYVVQAEYKQRVNGQAQELVTLDNVVFYDQQGMLETGMLGIKYKMQISTSVLAGKPNLNDSFVIYGREYKVISVTTKRNPMFVDFYEVEVKSATTRSL